MNRVCLISEDEENQQPAMIMGHRMNNDKRYIMSMTMRVTMPWA